MKYISWFTVLIFIALIAFFSWQAQKFEIDASAKTLLLKDNKHYIISQLSSLRYNPKEFILIAYKPNSKDIFSNRVLSRIDEIANKIKKIDRVSDVRSLVNVPIFYGIDDLSINIDTDDLSWKQKKFDSQFLKKVLKNHPLYEDLLVNKEQNALSMQVLFKTNKESANLHRQIIGIKKHLLSRELSDKENKHLKELERQKDKIDKKLDKKRIQEIEKIRAVLKPYKKTGNFYLGGNNLLAYQLIKIIKNDLVLFGSLITLIISIILFLLFRKLRWVFLPLFCCATSVIITLGLLGALGLKVTVISANVIALQIILSLAMIIHLIEQYRELVDKEDYEDQIELVKKTVKKKIKPCIYAGITTTIGFGSLIFSGVQPVISFGWMMVIAMIVTITVSLVFFPALLITFFKISKQTKEPKFVEGAMKWCASLVERRPKAITFFCIVITSIGVFGCVFLTAENSFLNYFSESTDVHRELSYIDKHFGGSTPFDILYSPPPNKQDPNLLLTAEAAQKITAIQNMLSEKKAIGSITSIADFTRIAQVVNKNPLTEYELTTLYRSLDNNLKEDLFGSYFSKEANEVRISTRIQDTTKDLDRAEFIKSIHEGMKKLGVNKKNYQLTNLFVLYQDILSRLVNSQALTLALVYFVMALVLIIIFASLKVALIAIVPNFITTAVILGTMGLTGIPLDLMTITIAAVAMGISVDDTIHYVHRFLEEKASSDSEVVKRTHLSVGYALLYTTTVITIGFISLVFSNFVPSILFGILTGIAMVVAWLTDITILPVLLDKFINPSKNK